MANITHFNVSDVALYYQGLAALTELPIATSVAAEEIRRRAVTYVERRRAMFSLPSLRGQSDSLGEKILLDLRQMNLANVSENKVKLTGLGRVVIDMLKNGEGRRARLAILGRLVETYDNAAILCATVTPPSGKPLYVPIPRVASEQIDDEEDDGETSLVSTNMESLCAAWADWCKENKRTDLMPEDLKEKAEALIEASTDKRGFAGKARNALAQLVVGAATNGRISKAPIYRTIRDRLSTAGALNAVIRPVPNTPLSVEVVFSCMNIGRPANHAEEWQPLGAKLMLNDDIWVHEAAPERLGESVLVAMQAARQLVIERAGYYRIYELRDNVCESLRLSQGMFDSVFVHLYRTRPGLMTLGFDYEKITAKRLPIEIRDGASSNLFNLVAFKER